MREEYKPIKPKTNVNNYVGKADLKARTIRVNRETRPALKKMHAEGEGGPTTRKGGGK